jgi:hypothetical protein
VHKPKGKDPSGIVRPRWRRKKEKAGWMERKEANDKKESTLVNCNSHSERGEGPRCHCKASAPVSRQRTKHTRLWTVKQKKTSLKGGTDTQIQADTQTHADTHTHTHIHTHREREAHRCALVMVMVGKERCGMMNGSIDVGDM